MLVALGVAPLACSSSSAGCDDSKCAAGNKCVNTGTTTACELLCSSQTACPANYHCGPNKDGSTNYCQPDGVTYPAKKTGQWGSHCNPTGGLPNNPDCDTADQFWCYGRNPTDDQSFCTQFQCTKDSDCGLDYVCQTVNSYPDVEHSKRQYGVTTTVCLPRTYCEPCNTDIDCVGPTGVGTSCITGSDNVKFCSTACQNDGNCRQDASCDTGSGFCKPLAGVCKGDGSFCSPCHADSDCGKGDGSICVTQEYSGEQYCSQKSQTPCTVSNPACKSADAYCIAVSQDTSGNLVYGCSDTNSTTCDATKNVTHFGCPTTTVQSDPVSCSIDNANINLPQDQCYGLVTFGTGSNANYVDGCWTKSSK